MITLKNMTWDNCFSYAGNNSINFDENPLTQLVGTNGAGKTCISLMLQEVLYGKNIKNIKKQDIANNKTNKKGYAIDLLFEKDLDTYLVSLDRTTSLKFKLFKNGEDISSHTSLNTYKTLAEIIGIPDFKIFCQLIYQHSTDSLDFLTATDTNRKKFLISLLQLDRYLELHEQFKDKVRIINNEISSVEGGLNTIQGWIDNNKDLELVKRELITVHVIPQEWYDRKSSYENKINNINSINRKIVLNREYKEALDALDSKYYMSSAPAAPKVSVNELRAQVRVIENEYNTHHSKYNKIDEMSGECPTCFQPINIQEQERLLMEELGARDSAKTKMGNLWTAIPKAEKTEAEIKKFKIAKTEFERLSQLIDPELQLVTLDKHELNSKLTDINKLLVSNKRERDLCTTENLIRTAHNSKVDVVKNQLKQMQKDLHTSNVALIEKECLANVLELLKKTFGTNGLVSYKIESSVKELEKKINTYLSDLTQFQIYFKLSGEKLNIEVVDDIGNVTSISNLSSGERARVNIATILAIRSILSSLTSTKINLLFLDEVIGVIDAEGKEKLSEVLLQESLNTFIVSHDWSHPLIPRINIVKENNISRIENG